MCTLKERNTAYLISSTNQQIYDPAKKQSIGHEKETFLTEALAPPPQKKIQKLFLVAK